MSSLQTKVVFFLRIFKTFLLLCTWLEVELYFNVFGITKKSIKSDLNQKGLHNNTWTADPVGLLITAAVWCLPDLGEALLCWYFTAL